MGHAATIASEKRMARIENDQLNLSNLISVLDEDTLAIVSSLFVIEFFQVDGELHWSSVEFVEQRSFKMEFTRAA